MHDGRCRPVYFQKRWGLVWACFRSSRPEAFNFIKKETLAQIFSCEFCEIFQNAFLYKHLRWLLLMFITFLTGKSRRGFAEKSWFKSYRTFFKLSVKVVRSAICLYWSSRPEVFYKKGVLRNFVIFVNF